MADLFSQYAEALSRDPREERRKANLEAIFGGGQKFASGVNAAMDVRNKELEKKKLEEEKLAEANALQRMFGQMPMFQGGAVPGSDTLKEIAPFINATRDTTKPVDPVDAELQRELLRAKIQDLRTPKPPKDPPMPKPTNPLDDEIKRERLKQMRKGKGSDASVNSAYNLYKEARNALLTSLENTTTGPVMGRMPAITKNQQAAEGSIAAMAPVLKQLFRVAGEGTFSDADQRLLMRMVTDRTVLPEARVAIINNMDRIVRAKLGIRDDGSVGAAGDEIDDGNVDESNGDPLGIL